MFIGLFKGNCNARESGEQDMHAERVNHSENLCEWFDALKCKFIDCSRGKIPGVRYSRSIVVDALFINSAQQLKNRVFRLFFFDTSRLVQSRHNRSGWRENRRVRRWSQAATLRVAFTSSFSTNKWGGRGSVLSSANTCIAEASRKQVCNGVFKYST